MGKTASTFRVSFAKNAIRSALFAGSLLFVGCAHLQSANRAPAKAEKFSNVRLGIGLGEVKVGDRLAVLEEVCSPRVSRPEMEQTCWDKRVGTAVVVKVVSSNAAFVEPQNGLIMDGFTRVAKEKSEMK